MSEPVQVDVVRVFTDTSGNFGNELGVISVPVGGREQQIAAELGFSETVFVDDIADAVATIRIFTPTGELPFAGHPSVGAAWWLADRGTPVGALAEAAGSVAVRLEADVTWITGRAEWAPAFTFHAFDSPAEVDALDPANFGEGKHYSWAWASASASASASGWASADGVLRARMFAPAMGIVEDEATGAAAVRITSQLSRNLEIRQGAGSVIRTRLLDDGSVEVGGRTVFDRTLTV
jgi:predicted PhzF superfamily epimerase YddE/YHI9